MALLLSESFTGSDGAVWNASNWVLGRNPTQGGGATILSNGGRLAAGTLGGYSGSDRISRRVNFVAPADVDMQFSFKFDASETYPRAYIRANNAVDSGTGYSLALNKGTWAVSKSVSFSTNDISPSIPYTYTEGTLYKARFYVVGSAIKAKVWLAASAEPLTWGWEGTDATITAAGTIGFTTNSGSAPASGIIYLDDVSISDGVANTAPTVTVGANATVATGSVFSRLATANDSDGTISLYAWTIESRPVGSTAVASGTVTNTISFTPDVVGVYIIRCTVTDNFGSSAFDELSLTATAPDGVKKLRVAGAWQAKVVRARQGGVWV